MNTNVTKLLAIAAFASLAACTAETAESNEPSQVKLDESGNVIDDNGEKVDTSCFALQGVDLKACRCW